MNTEVSFFGLAWNSNDLIASKNACRLIYARYGAEGVYAVDSEGGFGNLDIYSVIDEEEGTL